MGIEKNEECISVSWLFRFTVTLFYTLQDLQFDACCEGLDVRAFLLTPIQRMPRYALLIQVRPQL